MIFFFGAIFYASKLSNACLIKGLKKKPYTNNLKEKKITSMMYTIHVEKLYTLGMVNNIQWYSHGFLDLQTMEWEFLYSNSLIVN